MKIAPGRINVGSSKAAFEQLSAVLAAEMRRDVDSACRYGGEEFAVILPNTTAAAAVVAALSQSAANQSNAVCVAPARLGRAAAAVP